jgi:hypothetical protein
MSLPLLAPRRRRGRAQATPDPAADRPEPPPDHHTDRRAPAPEDLASYGCSCGLVFKAEPTTTIGCPRCGTQQAW